MNEAERDLDAMLISRNSVVLSLDAEISRLVNFCNRRCTPSERERERKKENS